MSSSTPFPWHYFIRSIRTRIILIVLSSFTTYAICQNYNEDTVSMVVFAALFFTLTAIVQGYIKIVPFRKTLGKIDEIQVQLPHNKKLNIIYQKNEWILIQEMLKLTEKYIREQNELILNREQEAQIILESIADPIILLDSFLNCKQFNQSFSDRFIQNKETKVFLEDKLWKIFEDKKILTLFEKAKKDGVMARRFAHKIGSYYFR